MQLSLTSQTRHLQNEGEGFHVLVMHDVEKIIWLVRLQPAQLPTGAIFYLMQGFRTNYFQPLHVARLQDRKHSGI